MTDTKSFKTDISRNNFLKKIGRLLLLSVLAAVALILGNRITSVNNCDSCPGRGLCKGENDCSNYLSGK